MLSTSSGMNLVPLKWRYYALTGTVGGVSLARPQMSVASIDSFTYEIASLGSWSSGQATIDSLIPTGVKIGDRVCITDSNNGLWDGVWSVSDIISSTVFKIRSHTQIANDVVGTNNTKIQLLNQYIIEITAHKLAAGDIIRLSGATNKVFNQPLTVENVFDSNNVLVRIPNTNKATGEAATTTGTIKADMKCMAQRALILSKTGTVTIGPNTDADAISLAVNTSQLIEMPNGAKFDLADWYVKGAQTVGVLFV